MLSAISFSSFSYNDHFSYTWYLYSRFIRLVLPTWLFLLFYNSIVIITDEVSPSLMDILYQITFIGGTDIGVWIIRIFVSIALIAPLLYKINNSIKANNLFYVILAFAYLTYELINMTSSLYLDGNILKLFRIIFCYTIAYSLIFLYGLRITTFSHSDLKSHSIFLVSLFILLIIIGYSLTGEIVPTQHFKYPPTCYYLSYSMIISISLYRIVISHNFRIQDSKLIKFIGQSTLWIYLWHWFVIKIYFYIGLDYAFVTKYVLIYSLTILIVYLQTLFTQSVISITSIPKRKAILIKKIFTG